MTDAQLYSEIITLPDDLKNQVSDFVAKLKSRPKSITQKEKKERQFGCAKGLIEISPDFDEPLEEFKEYM